MTIDRAAALLLSAWLATACAANDPVHEPSVPVRTTIPVYPAELLVEGVEGRVEIAVKISSEGGVIDTKVLNSSDTRFEAACDVSVRQWRFQPTRLYGRPHEGVHKITFEFREGKVALIEAVDPNADAVPPRLLNAVHPEFPAELNKTLNSGTVEVVFIVDTDGCVQEPKVVTSTHPAFEGPAVAALLKWTFAPATKGGRPFAMRMRQAIRFTYGFVPDVESFKVSKGSKSKLPEMLQVDVQPKPRITVFSVHPHDEAIAQRRGSAEVKILVGSHGKVVSSEVVKASKQEFGLALAAAMEAWTFEPAQRDGKPSSALLKRRHEFGFRDRDSAMDGDTTELAVRIRKGRFEPAKAGSLDRPLQPRFTAPPVYPTALLNEGKPGRATIEVIVDKRGRAVLPRIVEASEPEFGWAAATAAQRWQFNPPMVKGKPVEMKVVIPFKFTPPEPEAAGSAK